MSQPTPTPFAFKDSALITLALGRVARDLRELRDRVAEVPTASLLHHFYEQLLRPSFDDPEFPNDFAVWARHALREDALAERLAVLDPAGLDDGEALRGALIEILDDRLAEARPSSSAPEGRPFQFLRSQLVVFDTGQIAHTPEELARAVGGLSTGSVFFHFVDARLREPRGEDDFSAWLTGWDTRRAAARLRLAAIDPVFGRLDELRERIADELAAVFAEPV